LRALWGAGRGRCGSDGVFASDRQSG
jgi:hypothetical protein